MSTARRSGSRAKMQNRSCVHICRTPSARPYPSQSLNSISVGVSELLPVRSANTPCMSRKALPAAVLVATGCSVAHNASPQPLSLRTKYCRSFNDRARRLMRVTNRVSPAERSRAASAIRCARRSQRPPLQGEILVQRQEAACQLAPPLTRTIRPGIIADLNRPQLAQCRRWRQFLQHYGSIGERAVIRLPQRHQRATQIGSRSSVTSCAKRWPTK